MDAELDWKKKELAEGTNLIEPLDNPTNNLFFKKDEDSLQKQNLKNSQPAQITTCSLCGSGILKFKFKIADGGHQIFGCENCGYSTLLPQPSDLELAGIYTKDYFFFDVSDRRQRHFQALKQKNASQYLDEIIDYLGQSKNIDLLELGFGCGDLLKEAVSRGIRITGIDYSDYAVNKLTEDLKGKGQIFKGELEILNAEAQKFDICVLADVIEHVRDPHLLLQQVCKLLKPGGVCFIFFPSLDSWSARLLKNNWMEYKAEHLHYFSSKTISKLIRDNGLSDLKEKSGYKTLSLDYISYHFEKYPVPFFSPLIKFLMRVLPSAIVRAKVRVVANGTIILCRKKQS